MPQPTTYIFCGGGTGGHLYPALAIAERLHELAAPRGGGPEADRGGEDRYLFLCSQRAVDREILGGELVGGRPVEFRPLPAMPVSLKPLGLARFVGGWGPSVRQAREAIREAGKEGTEAQRHRGTKGGGGTARGPRVVVVAMGGFVAAPGAQAARVEKVELVLVNLDAVPGKANRWIARRADRVLTAADVGPVGVAGAPGPQGQTRGGWERIGAIVRRQAMAPGIPAECRVALGLDPDRPVLLVTGASQGARSLNELMVELVERELGSPSLRGGPGATGAFAGWQVLHQTGRQGGPGEVDAVRAVYEDARIPAVVEPLVREMGLWWGAAELALARAGAGIVAEVAANRVPAVFAPYPGHRDQHQAHNAAGLVAAGGAVVGEDLGSGRANVEGLGRQVVELMQDPARRQAMRTALCRLARADGGERAARALAGV